MPAGVQGGGDACDRGQWERLGERYLLDARWVQVCFKMMELKEFVMETILQLYEIKVANYFSRSRMIFTYQNTKRLSRLCYTSYYDYLFINTCIAIFICILLCCCEI